MRQAILVSAILSLALLTPAVSTASPGSDVMQAFTAFRAVKSFHAQIKSARGTVEMDIINPNKQHVVMQNGMEMIHIDPDTWFKRNGQWTHLPNTPERLESTSGGIRTMGLGKTPNHDNLDVLYVGTGSVDGQTAAHYHVTDKTNGSISEIWIGSNHLPLQLVETMKDGSNETITFSNYNGVGAITAPM